MENNNPNIINWTYKLPKNCYPVEPFLTTLKHMLDNIPDEKQIHIILDGCEVTRISIPNKMKMDAFWKRYKLQLREKINYTTIFVETQEQQSKLTKIYKSSSSTTPYRVILKEQLKNFMIEPAQYKELSNNVLLS